MLQTRSITVKTTTCDISLPRYRQLTVLSIKGPSQGSVLLMRVQNQISSDENFIFSV